MNRNDDGQRGDGAGPGIIAWLPVFAIIPLILLGIASAAHLMRREAGRPIVGDMILFTQNMPGREMFRVVIPATVVDPAPGMPTHCRLDSGVLSVSGGSLLIQQRLPLDPPWFRLHWSGPKTDADGRDCGTVAQLDVTRLDLRKLATAAGGFGLDRR